MDVIETLLNEAHRKLDRAERSYIAFDTKLDRDRVIDNRGKSPS